MSGLVRLEPMEADGTALLLIDNPPMNALSFALQAELDDMLGELERRNDVRAVVVAGADDRVFSAGAEITELDRLRDPDEAARIVARLHRIFARLEHLPQPTVAAIEGAAVGGGTELALACTFRVAGATARLGLPEVRLGLIPGGGGTQRLARLVGLAAALDLILGGRTLGAEDARAAGLVHRVADAGGARAAALEMAASLAALPRVAVQAAKRAVLAQGTDDGYAAELVAFVAAASSADMPEGVDAFLAKRLPRFTHR
ncbi:MAG: enoyl-CoA hydratase-related protein [Acidimicrobiales bacterium]|nr:enoyl-CoA hydratase-related protein [Acidimicrobiales bacterium]